MAQTKNPHPREAWVFESFRLKGLGLGLAVLCHEHVLVDQQLGAATYALMEWVLGRHLKRRVIQCLGFANWDQAIAVRPLL